MSNRRDRLLLGLAVFLACLSLVLNLVLIWQLGRTREAARSAVGEAMAGLDALYASDLRYDFHLNQAIPFRGDVPIHEDLLFPIRTEVQVSTVIPVTVLNVPLSVPIHTTVPISTQVPVRLDTSVPVSLTVPLDLTIPIAVSLKDTPLHPILQRMRNRLSQLHEGL